MYLKYINLFDFWTRFFLIDHSEREIELFAWNQKCGDPSFTRGKIGSKRRLDEKITLTLTASNGSGFLIFPQKSREGERRWGKEERENWTRKSLKQDRLCYSLFPEKWRARKRTGVRGLSLWRGKILLLNKRRVSTRENTTSSISQQVVISGGGGLKKARTYQRGWLNDEERKIRDRFSPISFSLSLSPDRNPFNSVFISPTTISRGSIDPWYILMILRDRSNCFPFRLLFETNIVYIHLVIDHIVRAIIEENVFLKDANLFFFPRYWIKLSNQSK